MNQREWIEHNFKKDMAAFRAKHGVAKAVSTGPVTAEEVKAAREATGNPQTHEEWVEADQAADVGRTCGRMRNQRGDRR